MISFANDPAVTDALRHWRGKEVWPTEFGSGELRAFSREIHLRSIVSARTTSADYLNEVARVVDDMLAGKINLATGRLRLMRKLKELGYDPAIGFPQDMASIPPAEADSLQDLSSRMRIDLLLKTNVAMARNYGRVISGNTPAARFAFPAWELVRLGVRNIQRGTPESHTAGWQRRWTAAGESVDWHDALQGRMIALKDSPIWQALGDGDGGDWSDTLGNPYPPFAFNSGMDWRAVPRAECGELLMPGASPEAMMAKLAPTSAELRARFDRLAPDLKAELLRSWAE